MDECKNRAPGSLEWKEGDGALEQWNKWVEQFDTTGDKYLDMGSDQYFFAGYESRQPEIDALIHDNGNMLKAITEYDKENVALKAENEALRKQIDTMSATCVILNHSVGGMKAENEKLRKVASEAIAAIGSYIDGRDVCFDAVIENLTVAVTAPDTKGE